jgi:hypothetical protein
LVITPAKMLKFYEDVKLRDETYPWQGTYQEAVIFKIHTNLLQLSLGSFRIRRCPRYIVACAASTTLFRSTPPKSLTFLL